MDTAEGQHFDADSLARLGGVAWAKSFSAQLVPHAIDERIQFLRKVQRFMEVLVDRYLTAKRGYESWEAPSGEAARAHMSSVIGLTVGLLELASAAIVELDEVRAAAFETQTRMWYVPDEQPVYDVSSALTNAAALTQAAELIETFSSRYLVSAARLNALSTEAAGLPLTSKARSALLTAQTPSTGTADNTNDQQRDRTELQSSAGQHPAVSGPVNQPAAPGASPAHPPYSPGMGAAAAAGHHLPIGERHVANPGPRARTRGRADTGSQGEFAHELGVFSEHGFEDGAPRAGDYGNLATSWEHTGDATRSVHGRRGEAAGGGQPAIGGDESLFYPDPPEHRTIRSAYED